jgi:hypothetical protein
VIDVDPLEWSDYRWEDPDGGSIYLHGVLPCVVYPLHLRPRVNWDGTAFLATNEELEIWLEEEIAEKDSPGINLASALMSGGLTGRYLDSLDLLEDIKGPNFPDPEPRRIHRLAEKNDRPIYWIEPTAEDDEWMVWLEDQATRITHPWRLLKVLFKRGRYRKLHLKLASISKPAPGMGAELFIAGALSGAWWYEQELRNGEELNQRRDSRLASRLRGALADLREKNGTSDVTMLVPHHVARRSEIVKSLDNCEKVEKIQDSLTLPENPSSVAAESQLTEEEE